MWRVCPGWWRRPQAAAAEASRTRRGRRRPPDVGHTRARAKPRTCSRCPRVRDRSCCARAMPLALAARMPRRPALARAALVGGRPALPALARAPASAGPASAPLRRARVCDAAATRDSTGLA